MDTQGQKKHLSDQELVKNAKALRNRIEKADRENRNFREKRYPEKSMLQILRRLRGALGSFHEAVAIALIKRKWKKVPPEKLDPEEVSFVAEEEQFLREQNQLPVEVDCHV
jgi:hypothetical protein